MHEDICPSCLLLFVDSPCSAGNETVQRLSRRDLRMTWTLFLICFSYYLFVMPITMMNMFSSSALYPQLDLCFCCINYLQYSLNFVIYALRSEQYR